GDLCWAAGDLQARGFLIGATAGRTTLNGEGLQHQDGHSHLVALTIPNCKSYDPTYGYELAVIIQDGIRRMYGEGENCFYYVTSMNENYAHPAMPEGAEEGIIKGMYLLKEGEKGDNPRVQLMGAGSILVEVQAAAEMLKSDWNVDADIWSMTSINEVYREAKSVDRWNLLHPKEEPRIPMITSILQERKGPKVIATDYIQAHSELLRGFIPGTYRVLGTDGFGRSDTRAQLRNHFEVDRNYVTVAALRSLADDGVVNNSLVADAIAKYGIDPEKADPMTL
ncbi:MAG: pyruvate dehydrogenase (acetyl-transferring), homodimeric type, partial [Gammaproteobacteria bacterium]